MVDISVIMPAYNVEDYIESAIESCLNQTLKNIEIIIVNDGSTDRTGNIAYNYSKKHSNIVYIETINQGLSMARNTGMKVAKGEYIYFLDSDDWIEDECLEKCLYELSKYNLDYVTFDSVMVYENENGLQWKEQIGKQNLDCNKIYTGVQIAELIVKKGGLPASVWKNVYRRSFIENNNLSFVKDLYYEDNPFQLKVLSCAKRIKYISLGLHRYRIRKNSIMTSKMSINKINSSFDIANIFFDFCENQVCEREIWKSYIATSLCAIWICNFAGMSANDFKSIEKFKEIILCKKNELLYRINKIYKTESNSSDDIRNMCKLAEIVLLTLNYKNDEQEKVFKDVLEDNKRITIDILSEYPLKDKQKIIGVYGSGVNADYILNLYEKYVGKINADIIYIDSNIASYTKKHHGKDIINVKDISKTNIDEIVVLSFLYEQEMYDTIHHLYDDKYPIYRFYTGSRVSVEGTMGEIYELENKFRTDKRHVWLMATPEHCNIGDHLIAKGVYVFCEKYLNEYEVIEITQNQYLKYRGIIYSLYNQEDIILISGGGFLGSLWENELTVVENILQDFSEYKIVILPQSIYYENSEYGNYRKEVDVKLFEKQKDLTICFREDKSLKRFNSLFIDNVKTLYLPDMALLIDDYKTEFNRKDIIFCFRDDKEQVVDEYEKEVLKIDFINKGFNIYEESMIHEKSILIMDRMGIIERKLDRFAQSSLVITDRLHCMIACAITGTPCIALDNLSGKVSGVYEWIKELEYIKIVKSVYEIIEKDLNNCSQMEKKHTYSKQFANEFMKLVEIIKD